MPQSNTVINGIYLPSAGLGNATSETQFNGSNAALLTCIVPGTSKLKNRPFTVRVAGRVTGGTTTNFTLKVYWGTSSTIGSNTQLATSGAIAVNSASANFDVTLVLMWDATSQKIQGRFSGQMNNSLVAAAALSNAVSSVDLTAGETSTVGLTATGLFSASNASNTAIIDVFEIDVD